MFTNRSRAYPEGWKAKTISHEINFADRLQSLVRFKSSMFGFEGINSFESSEGCSFFFIGKTAYGSRI